MIANAYLVLSAQAPSAVSASLDGLVQYGALGLVLVLALWALYKKDQQATANAKAQADRADRAEEALRAAQERMQDRALVTLGDATRAIEKVTILLQQRGTP